MSKWIITPEELKALERGDQYNDAKAEARSDGLIFYNGKEVAATLQCPHCGGHFVSRRGSGKRRTFCTYHMKIACGRLECDACPRLAGEIKMGFV
jgi:hypothetical protein